MASASNPVGKVVGTLLLVDAIVALVLCSAVIRSTSDHSVFDPVPSFPRTKLNEPRRLIFGAMLGVAALFRYLSFSGSRRSIWLAFLSYFLEPALIIAYGLPPAGFVNMVAALPKVDPILQARLLANAMFLLVLFTAGPMLSGLASDTAATQPARPASISTKGSTPKGAKAEAGGVATGKGGAAAAPEENDEPMSPTSPVADPLRALFETMAGPGSTTLDVVKMESLLRHLGQFDDLDEVKAREATQKEFRRALSMSGVRRRRQATTDGEKGVDAGTAGAALAYEDFVAYMREVFKDPEDMAQEALAPIKGAEKQSSLLEAYEAQLKEIFTETLRPRSSNSAEKRRASMGFATTGMDRTLFLQTLRERHVIDANFTDHDADIAFQKAKPRTSNRINFRQFYTALLSIAEKKRGSLNAFLRNFCEAT
eukprot:jgi/Mesvir1/19636/Mv09921-RA.1